MKAKQKVLFFCSFPPPNTGQTIANQNLYDCFKASSITDRINIVDKNRYSRKSGDFSASVVANLLSKYSMLAKRLLTGKYDAVFAVYSSTKFSLVRDTICTFIVKNFSKARLVVQVHAGDYGERFKGRFFKGLFKYVLKNVDKLMFSSYSLNNIHGQIDAAKVVYISNMVSPGVRCSAEEIEQKIRQHKTRTVINVVYISNMLPQKGYMDLIAAMKLIWAKGKTNYMLHLIGAWPTEEARVQVADDLKEQLNNEMVKIYGPVSAREEIKRFFLLADIFVLPTYYPIEAHPVSIGESFNAATPVISTYHASIPDMIADGVDGFLINIKSPGEIAERILEMEPPDKWAEMAAAARKTYENRNAEEVIMPQITALFV